MNRRKLLAGAGAAGATLTLTGAAGQAASANPDAELIAACEAHSGLQAAAFAGRGEMDTPAYAAWDACNTLIGEARPTTMAGVLAVAREARRCAVRPGETEPDRSYDGDAPVWAWTVMMGLLRVVDGT